MIDFDWDFHSTKIYLDPYYGYVIKPHNGAPFKTLSLESALSEANKTYNRVEIHLKCGAVLENPSIVKTGRFSILVKHKNGEHIL